MRSQQHWSESSPRSDEIILIWRNCFEGVKFTTLMGNIRVANLLLGRDATNVVHIKKLQLWIKFQIRVMQSLRLLSTTNASDHRRVKTLNLLHVTELPNLFSHETWIEELDNCTACQQLVGCSFPWSLEFAIPIKSRARHHPNLSRNIKKVVSLSLWELLFSKVFNFGK